MSSTSYISVTDQFCGAGGSSLGATAAGGELKLAMNHWKLAIETHNENFPNAAHDCTDISACDPRRYPPTTILITSPECTNHSLAKGKKRPAYKTDLFGNVILDPAEERSRATMWDVHRFAEAHRYQIIIVENVVDARKWVGWRGWIIAMKDLGYDYRCVYFNSMFAHPTPQSRDRMYVVFWRKGQRSPNLDFCPPAWCPVCERNVEGQQLWKNAAMPWGRYGARGQYLYVCPTCNTTVQPYYYPALTAIDWSLPIQRIGERERPLKEKTLARIQLGLERFAGQYLVLQTKYSHAVHSRASSVGAPWPTQTAQQEYALVTSQIVRLRNNETTSPVSDALGTISAGGVHAGLLMPFMVPITRQQDRERAVMEVLPTQTGTENESLVMPAPFLVRHFESRGSVLARGVDEPTGTITAVDHHSLILPEPFLSSYYGGSEVLAAVSDAMGTQTGQDRHGLVMPTPFLASFWGEGKLAAAGEAMGTQVGTQHQGIVLPAPFITSKYNGPGRDPNRDVLRPMPTVPGMQVHELVMTGDVPSVEDCGFRMLEPHEIRAAMAFPADYIIRGNKRQRVKQLGNAVTPPVMKMIFERCVESLS